MRYSWIDLSKIYPRISHLGHESLFFSSRSTFEKLWRVWPIFPREGWSFIWRIVPLDPLSIWFWNCNQRFICSRCFTLWNSNLMSYMMLEVRPRSWLFYTFFYGLLLIALSYTWKYNEPQSIFASFRFFLPTTSVIIVGQPNVKI